MAEHVAQFLGKALGPRVAGGSPQLLSELVAQGNKGKKTGKGLGLKIQSKFKIYANFPILVIL